MPELLFFILAAGTGAVTAALVLLLLRIRELRRELSALRVQQARERVLGGPAAHGNGNGNGHPAPGPARRKRHLDLFVFFLVGAVVLAGQWWHNQWRLHRLATLGGTVGTAALLAAAVLFFTVWSDPQPGAPPASAPRSTAPPYGTSMPLPTATSGDREPSPSTPGVTPSPEPTTTAPSAAQAVADASVTRPAGTTGEPVGTTPATPPPGATTGPTEPPPPATTAPPGTQPPGTPAPDPSPGGQNDRRLCAHVGLPPLLDADVCLLSG